MRNVLITGGAGFIGSNFVRQLLSEEPELQIINLDALTYAGSLENLKELPDPGRHTFLEGDICDRGFVNRLVEERSIDTIVHFAAETHVDRSIRGPAQFVETNVLGTFSLLEAARAVWLDKKRLPPDQVRFLHVSSDEVYGSLDADAPAFTENTSYSPNSPYAASKAASDHIVRAYEHTYGLPTLITNCSNNYGPFQFPEKLVPLLILNSISGLPLPIYGDGKQVRDWLYVEDHCEALLLVLRAGRIGETYNIGGNAQHTNLEVAQRVCSVLDDLISDSPHVPHGSLIQLVEDRPGHDRRYAMDIGKIGRELGWQPRHALEEGLQETVEWYIKNPLWATAARKTPEYQAWLRLNYALRGEVP